MNSTRIVYRLWRSRKLITIFCGFDQKIQRNSVKSVSKEAVGQNWSQVETLGHDEDRFVNRCDRMPRRTQRGVDETKENAVSAYRRVATSRSPRKQSVRFWPFQQHSFRARMKRCKGRTRATRIKHRPDRTRQTPELLTVASMACRGGVTDFLSLPFV